MAIEQSSLSETLRALRKLRYRVLSEGVFYEGVGICSNVKAFTGSKGNQVLRAVFVYLGLDNAEPIPNYSYLQVRGLLWQDDELYKRLYLIEACIAVLEGRLVFTEDSASFVDYYNGV